MFTKQAGSARWWQCGQTSHALLAVLSLSIIMCWSLALSALAADDSTTAGQQSSNTSGASPSDSQDQSDAQKPETGLNSEDINDVGYALQRIRQQAINIYIEAMRKQNSPEVSANIPALNRVPSEIPKSMKNLLPFRRPWLVYFLTSLEPLVHLLKQDVKDIETGNKSIGVSPEIREAINPLLDEWTQEVAHLDEDLTATMALVEHADKNNIELAKVAASIDQDVAKLEHVRDKAFRIVDAMEKAKKSAPKTGNSIDHGPRRVTVGL